jgi:hypothetical protein
MEPVLSLVLIQVVIGCQLIEKLCNCRFMYKSERVEVWHPFLGDAVLEN